MSLQTFKESGALMERVVTLDGMSWEGFNKIASDFDEVSSLKLSYLGGLLEIMAPISDEPENVKSTVGALLEGYMREKGTDFIDGVVLLRKRKAILPVNLMSLTALALIKKCQTL